MPSDAVLATLKHVWQTLESLDLPMAVIGGIAVSTWKHVRVTRDVDLLVAIGDTSPDDLVKRLAAVGIRPKRQDPLVKLSDAEFLQLKYEPPETFVDVQIDLLLAHSPYQRQALSRRVPVPSSELGFDVCVLSCEDLILHKLLAGRIIDRADAAALLRANRRSIDSGYLLKWTAALRLSGELAEIWDEAFPGELPPSLATP